MSLRTARKRQTNNTEPENEAVSLRRRGLSMNILVVAQASLFQIPLAAKHLISPRAEECISDMSESPSGKKRVLRCTQCRRVLTDCNADPCPTKAEKKVKAKNKQDPTSMRLTMSRSGNLSLEMPMNEIDPEEQQASEEEADISTVLGRTVYNDQTCEPQAYLIAQLESYTGLRGNSHWCCVRGFDEYGIRVELIVEASLQRWVLNDLYFFWKDLPEEIRSMPYEARVQFCRTRLPVGSEFRAVVIKLCGNTVRLQMCRNANPKFRLPLELVRAKGGNSSATCPWRYLIMLDLEASCDYDINPVVDVRSAEITEFPWVVLDTQTGEIVFEKTLFVRPDNLSGVTYYCTKLTGISQDMVRDGVTLPQALACLDEYIRTTFGEDRTAFRVVTDGPWDLQIQLYSECKRKNLQRPWYLNEFFDLKEEFRRCFPFFPPSFKPSLLTMLNAVSLDVVGKHHRGIDDCKTIAQIVTLMLRLGHQFDSPKVIPSRANFDPFADPDFVDFGSVCEPTSWKCATPTCGIWNRPWMYYCRFCDCRQTAVTVESLQTVGQAQT